MLLGWGHLSFFTYLPHLILVITVVIAPFFLSGASAHWLYRWKELGESRIQFFVIALLSTIGLAYLMPFFYSRGIAVLAFSARIQYLGAICFLGGYVIRIRAVRTLKRHFSDYVAIHEHHQLITTGIYSLIRHPVYLGKIVAVFGMFLVFPSWYGLFFFVLYSSILIQRISREERLLLKYFGSVYEEYTLKSFRLIPHLY